MVEAELDQCHPWVNFYFCHVDYSRGPWRKPLSPMPNGTRDNEHPQDARVPPPFANGVLARDPQE